MRAWEQVRPEVMREMHARKYSPSSVSARPRLDATLRSSLLLCKKASA